MVVVICVIVSSAGRLMYSAFTLDRAITIDVSAMTNIAPFQLAEIARRVCWGEPLLLFEASTNVDSSYL
jgi:hypothetical protein